MNTNYIYGVCFFAIVATLIEMSQATELLQLYNLNGSCLAGCCENVDPTRDGATLRSWETYYKLGNPFQADPMTDSTFSCQVAKWAEKQDNGQLKDLQVSHKLEIIFQLPEEFIKSLNDTTTISIDMKGACYDDDGFGYPEVDTSADAPTCVEAVEKFTLIDVRCKDLEDKTGGEPDCREDGAFKPEVAYKTTQKFVLPDDVFAMMECGDEPVGAHVFITLHETDNESNKATCFYIQTQLYLICS